MQETEVFDITIIFVGPFWPILANFGRFWPFLGLESGVNFIGLVFWPKND
jgi:hypothetical protein